MRLTRPEACEADSTRLRSDLRAIVGDGVAFSVMVGTGETYLPAFVLALGLGEIAAGLVATLPMLAGALLQLASPYAVRLLRSHRRWVVLCVLAQAISFLPLVWGAWRHDMSVLGVFCVAAVYWGTGLAAGPAWNTWVGTLVPVRMRAHFFARRTRLVQAGTLAGFLLGGLSLQAASRWGDPLVAFAALFSVAGACRFLSAKFLWSQAEPEPPHAGHRHVSLAELGQRVRYGSGRVLVYLLAVQASVQISSAYFTPLMLKQLQFSYLTYVTVVAGAYVAKALALPALGKVAHRYGARTLLWIGGVGIVPLSALWLVSQSFPWLLFIQVAGGVVWAAYELAALLLFFESIHAEERTSVLTTYNLAHAVATITGGLVGALLLGLVGASLSAYLSVFALSSVCRLAALALLVRASMAVEAAPATNLRVLDEPAGMSLEDAAAAAQGRLPFERPPIDERQAAQAA
ncbi:MAG: MFS transporter [Pirellulales bacterium]|nr:MFS transporter [Pirellulales bacterium]